MPVNHACAIRARTPPGPRPARSPPAFEEQFTGDGAHRLNVQVRTHAFALRPQCRQRQMGVASDQHSALVTPEFEERGWEVSAHANGGGTCRP